MGTTISDKNRIIATIKRNKARLDAGFPIKGRRWLIGPNPFRADSGEAYFVKDLRKGPESKSYIICKPKPFNLRKEIHNYNHMHKNWIWYH